VTRKLLGADVRLTLGTARVLLRMPDERRKRAVDELVEQGELPRAKKGTGPVRNPKEVAQGLVARLQKKGRAREVGAAADGEVAREGGSEGGGREGIAWEETP
jgi:hypothetical protein